MKAIITIAFDGGNAMKMGLKIAEACFHLNGYIWEGPSFPNLRLGVPLRYLIQIMNPHVVKKG